MKNSFVASILIGVSGCACAQSGVTLFGVIDATAQRGSGSIANVNQLGSGANTSSRLGFRGTEDLGGGLSASFWLESGLLIDSGTGSTTNTNNQATGTAGAGGIVFGRRSTVSLAGRWGELRLGRDYSPQYYNRFAYDPYGNNGVGSSQTNVGSLTSLINRVSNSAAYHLPEGLGGFYGVVQYYAGENVSSAGASRKDGSGGGARLGWKRGDFDIAVAHQLTEYATTASAGDITSTNIGGRYNHGAVSLMGGYFRDKIDRSASIVGKGPQVGVVWRIGAGEVKALYSGYQTSALGSPETKKVSLGYVHSLSKRTGIYATIARVNNSGGAATALNGASTAANKTSSGLDLGVRHSF